MNPKSRTIAKTNRSIPMDISDENIIHLIIEYCPHGTLEQLIKK